MNEITAITNKETCFSVTFKPSLKLVNGFEQPIKFSPHSEMTSATVLLTPEI